MAAPFAPADLAEPLAPAAGAFLAAPFLLAALAGAFVAVPLASAALGEAFFAAEPFVLTASEGAVVSAGAFFAAAAFLPPAFFAGAFVAGAEDSSSSSDPVTASTTVSFAMDEAFFTAARAAFTTAFAVDATVCSDSASSGGAASVMPGTSRASPPARAVLNSRIASSTRPMLMYATPRS